MLDVRRMRVLREVAIRGSFSAAAEALSFTQSAVSQQIAALEREAGTTLVQRSARGVRLTDAGEAVVRHAEAIMARLAEAEAELEAIAGLRGGRLRLAAFESAGSTLMPLAIAAFRELHPAVELSMSLVEPEDSVPMLRSGELDVAIVFESAAVPDVDGIDRLHLLEDPMYLALPREHPLAHRRRVRLEDLAGEAWVAGAADCECNRLLSRACAMAGYQPRIAFETERDDIVVRDLGRDTPVRQIYAATLADGYRAPATQAMLDILADVAAGYASRRPRLTLVG
jgi:DNA-binding transcriptional LysR family regulator